MKLILALLLACMVVQAQAQTPGPSGGILAADGGRFVLGQLSTYRRDQYLLDTKEGRVWRLVCAGESKAAEECPRVVFEPAIFQTIDGTLTIGPYTSIPPKAAQK